MTLLVVILTRFANHLRLLSVDFIEDKKPHKLLLAILKKVVGVVRKLLGADSQRGVFQILL